MAARKLTAQERRELPTRAFGIPSQRKYPIMVLGRDGKPKYSKGHAVEAKSLAKVQLEKGRIDSRQYKQIVRKADTAIRELERAKAKAKRNPPKKKVAKKKATKKKATKRRSNPSLKPKEKSLLFNVMRHAPYSKRLAHKKFGKETANSLLKSELIADAADAYVPGSKGFDIVNEFAPLSTREEDVWEAEVDRSAIQHGLRGNPRRTRIPPPPELYLRKLEGMDSSELRKERKALLRLPRSSDNDSKIDAIEILLAGNGSLPAKRNPAKKKATRRRRNPTEADEIQIDWAEAERDWTDRIIGQLSGDQLKALSPNHLDPVSPDVQESLVKLGLLEKGGKKRTLLGQGVADRLVGPGRSSLDGPVNYGNPTKKKATKKKVAKKKVTRRRRNPTEAQHEAVGIKALKNSEEYWRGYMADKSKTNLLVDAYKFLVIAHEELKYAGNAEPRLQADHMLKEAHFELSKLLK